MKTRLDADALRRQAHGHWLEIFQAVCPGVFDAAIRNLGTHVTCPFHGGENDFRLIKRSTRKGRGNTMEDGVAICTCGFYPDGFAVIRRATGWSFPEVLQQVDEYLNGSSLWRTAMPAPVIQRPTKAEDDARDAELRAKVVSLWDAGKPFDAKQVPYYVSRGISPRTLQDVQDTRFLRSLGYFQQVDGELTKLGSFPALLALMRDPDGNPVAVHRTWLSAAMDDKAPVAKAKKLTMTPGASGGAIRLYDAMGSDVLGLTEGIETAHAARQLASGRYWPELGKVPVWACYAEATLRAFVIPKTLLPTLKKIVIFADHDESGTGQKASLALKERMATEHPEIEVDIKLPTVHGWDWLDVLVNL